MKWILTCVLLLIVSKNVFSQIPEKLSYQAIIRYGDNSLVANSNVDVKINLLKGSAHGVSVYEETHYVQTNKNGLVTLEIGTGNVISGSFKSIDWENGPFFTETQVDPTGRSNYSVIGVSQLLSVPYALHAKSAATLTGTISASQLTDMDLYEPDGTELAFDNWDTNVNDDFDGKYSSLKEAPKVYTQEEVDNIKAEILQEIEQNYSKKASVASLSSNRNANTSDVGNTVACISSATLTISSGFSAMEVGDVINLEVHGVTLTIKGASGVIINGKSGGSASIGNDEVYTGGLVRKTGNNSYIVL